MPAPNRKHSESSSNSIGADISIRERESSMKALRELRRFILIKSTEGNQAEIRHYIVENIEALARSFHVPTRVIIDAVQGVKDDGALATKFLETIVRAEAILRQNRKDRREEAAHSSAAAIGSVAQWDGEKATVDILSLLASALTRRNDLMVFVCDGFEIGVNQAILFDLARLKRRDLTAFVDPKGLHVKWSSGGLNLYPQSNSKAERVVVPLPAAPMVIAA